MINIMSIKNFSKEIKTDVRTIKKWIKTGDLPLPIYKKIGTETYILIENYNKWITETNGE